MLTILSKAQSDEVDKCYRNDLLSVYSQLISEAPQFTVADVLFMHRNAV